MEKKNEIAFKIAFIVNDFEVSVLFIAQCASGIPYSYCSVTVPKNRTKVSPL
jgi:hypothetical protein